MKELNLKVSEVVAMANAGELDMNKKVTLYKTEDIPSRLKDMGNRMLDKKLGVISFNDKEIAELIMEFLQKRSPKMARDIFNGISQKREILSIDTLNQKTKFNEMLERCVKAGVVYKASKIDKKDNAYQVYWVDYK